MNNKREIGQKAENAAAELYKKAGYEIIGRNFHYHRLGEIDIIAVKDNCIIFSEVKYRKQNDFSVPSEAVNGKKIFRIKTCAMGFIEENNIFSDYSVRFDVAEVTSGEKKYIINIIKDAF